MSASETAEAILIVIRRLGKWILWLVAGIFTLLLLALGWMEGKKYIDNKPYRATMYAGMNIGDPQNKVLYTLGPPPQFINPAPQVNDENPFSQFDQIIDSNNPEEKSTYLDSKEWLYTEGSKRIDVAFDALGGRVKSIACYSNSYYSCPPLFGIHDGSSEEEVLSHLGKPTSEKIDGVTKTIRYSDYNLTLYLMKRQVYMLMISENATL